MDWVQKMMFGRMAQLHVHYRGSRLSRHLEAFGWFRRTRVRAGDRAPDVAFRKADTGERTTLFELLQPMRPVLLIDTGSCMGDTARLTRLMDTLARLDIDAYCIASAGEELAENCPNCRIDVHGDFRGLYGMTGEFLCLIRPDDHVGLYQRGIDERALYEYLGQMCAPEDLARAVGAATRTLRRPAMAATPA
jgi:hypothetical protein